MMKLFKPMSNFYTKYLKYYLNNPSKPALRIHFIICVLLIISINIFLTFSNNNQLIALILGGLVSIIMLSGAFYFGYLGFLTNLFFCTFGITMTLRLWFAYKDFLFLNIVTFQFAVTFASFFIALLCERERIKSRKLEWMSIIDGLTEVYNHRYLQQKLEQEMERALKGNTLLGLAMIDIDNFKKYNDLLGHTAGDVILKKASDFLKANIRETDLIFRYGGDEFAILIKSFDKKNDFQRMEKIIKSFENLNISIGSNQLADYLTMSIGFSVFPESAATKDELVKQADDALYMAKNAGRNRIQFYRDVLDEIRLILNKNEQQIISNLKVLLATVSVKDRYTLGHSERVSNYVFRLCNALGLREEETKTIVLATLLHDIGKIEIPESILNKKEKLTADEMETIKQHPVYSATILGPLEEICDIIPSVRHHHERYDGTGYPDGLSGEAIPYGARILSIADAFDAMLSDRPYRKGMKPADAVQQLIDCSGTQFDPQIVQAFVKEIGINY